MVCSYRRVLILAASVGVIRRAARKRRERRERDGSVSYSRVSRTAALGRLAAMRGADTALTAARTQFSSKQKSKQLQLELERRHAHDLVSSLGHMKGALMKIGQMASYIDEGMPPAIRESLATLQQDAPPMQGVLAIDVIEGELGGRLGRFFRDFDEQPVAAASIGQVHRAVTRAGTEVAVKVQYPGIARAVAADLDNTAVLGSLLGAMFPGLDTDPLVGELQVRLNEELDYKHEARNQQLFVDFYQDHPWIHVPTVFHELSTAKVITTEFVHGQRFEQAVETSDQSRRDDIAELIFRYVFRGLYRIGAFNGDPHPGNYIFEPDGRIAFLDYGLVKYFTAADTLQFERLIRSMLAENPSGFRSALEDFGLLRKDAPFSDEELYDWFSHYYAIVLTEGPITITSEYASSMVRYNFDPKTNQILKYANIPPSFVLTQRINLGLYAILARLGATANYRAIAEELWPWVNGEPSTPIGEAESAWLAAKP